MVQSVSAQDLFAMLTEERKTGELRPLDKDLYERAAARDSSNAENGQRQGENKKHIVNMLRARRAQKILTYLAYGRSLPHPVPAEEERLYIRIKEIINQEEGPRETTRLRILNDAPEIVTSDGRKMGPFLKNTIIDVEKPEDTEFLIKNKIGERTNQ